MSRDCSTLSWRHLQSAIFFTNEAEKLEHKYGHLGPGASEEIRAQHFAYVTGGILSAAYYLEMYIDEILAGMADGKLNLIPGDRRGSVPAMLSVVNHFATLKRYRVLLELAGKEDVTPADTAYRSAETVIILRNALVHNGTRSLRRPRSRAIADDVNTTLALRLGSPFANPFASAAAPFFPDRCLCHGCAEFAVRACEEFVEEVDKKMNEDDPEQETRA